MKKFWFWFWLIVAAVVVYFVTKKKTATKTDTSGNVTAPKTVMVDSAALAAYKNGTATTAQMKSLGWPFIAEASLSFLSGSEGAQVLVPMTNGPAVRASAQLHESALHAAEELNPDYNSVIDGYTAKLAFMNAMCQKYGRPKVYGFEDQSQPHNFP